MPQTWILLSRQRRKDLQSWGYDEIAAFKAHSVNSVQGNSGGTELEAERPI